MNIKENDYEKYLEESIKCHHNEIASYIYNNFIEGEKQTYLKNILRYGFQYDNYFFINDIKNKFMFYYACEFSYFNLVDLFINHTKIDVNKKISSIEKTNRKSEVTYFTALNLAAKENNQSVLNLLLSQKGIEIGPECFKNCLKLTEITIPSTVTKLGEKCFFDCKNLKKITIPSTVTEIGYKAFSDCPSLEELTIPTSVKSIKSCIISNCEKLKKITVPVSLLSHDVEEHIKLLNNKDCIYEKTENKNILKMTNTKSGEIYVIKNIPILYYKDKWEYDFLKRVSIFKNKFPTLIPVYNYLIPLFTNEENNRNLSEIEVINESGNVIYDGFNGYIVVSEFIENQGTFKDLIEKYHQSNEMNPIILKKILFGIASTMNFFHKNKSTFLNLMPSNVLIDKNNEPRIGFHAALNFEFLYDYQDIMYVSPEMIIDEDVDCSSDVYSFALIIYRMFANPVTFHNVKIKSWQQYAMKIGRGLRPDRPSDISDNYWNLICQCWHMNPSNRPNFEMIIEYLLLDDFDNNNEDLKMKTDLLKFDEYIKKLTRRVESIPLTIFLK